MMFGLFKKKPELLKRIHVNQHRIRSNAKHGDNLPVLTCKTSKDNSYGHELQIKGPSKIVYSPHKPLSCGAKVWIETKAPVKVVRRRGLLR